MNSNALILTTTGARTARQHTTPVAWFPSEDGGWLIVAASAGTASNPAWYHNIAAHPDRVEIEIAGRRQAVVARQLRGTERDQAWRNITAAVPRFARYQNKTDRQLPIICLSPATN